MNWNSEMKGPEGKQVRTWQEGDEMSFEDMHELPDADAPKDDGLANAVLFVEDCPKCRGTGNWRPGYKCFKCKGKGKLEFKTSASQRAQSKRSRVKRASAKAVEARSDWDSYLKTRPAIAEWLENASSGFSASLIASGTKYGSLTEGQERAVLSCVASDQDGLETFTNETPEAAMAWLVANKDESEFADSLYKAGIRYGKLTDGQLNAVMNNVSKEGDTSKDSELDLSPLLKGFYSVPDGDTRLKVAIRRPGKNSKWQGHIFVDDGAAYGARKNYGRQAPDGLYRGDIRGALAEILKDPKAAMVAYGKLTGTCGVCGRKLEDEQSVAAGIGPICAGRL